MIRRWLTAAAFLAVMGFASAGFAEGGSEQIAQFKTMLDQQAQLDTSNATAEDRDLIAKWIKEAEVLLASGDSDMAARRLRRVELGLDLIRAMVAAAEIRTAAEAQEAAAYNAPKVVEELQDEVDALKKKRAELQAELQRLQ